MRIKSIELEWFRGAAERVALEPNCKSMVVYGENGSGKSSFVDAVEYVLNNGSIEHLKHEYSGSHQVKAIPNTHKPEGCNTTVRLRFRDNSELSIDFLPSGSSKSFGAEAVAMSSWAHKQTVLRQNEVSEFIHNTKGQKYSALLPLFGLQNMETAAENLHKLARTVETESRMGEKKAKVQLIEDGRRETFGTQSDEEIIQAIADLHAEYCSEGSTTNDPLLRCGEVEHAIDSRISGYSAENQRHLLLKGVSETVLKHHVENVRTASVRLAGSLDPLIAERLAVLRTAALYAGNVVDRLTVECPACGQTVAVDAFREHIRTESERLQEIKEVFDEYRAAIGAVCDSLKSLKAQLDKPELKTWRDGLKDAAAVEGLNYLDGKDINLLRESLSDEDLAAIESYVSPIIVSAGVESKEAPPEVLKLTTDKQRLEVAKAIISAGDLKRELADGYALVALVNSLEAGARLEIRRQSQNIIGSISKDIERMWGILHPGVKIENVSLAIPPDADKAIDVVLKFHGLDQDSPRLTLSEGYRNSLGLCIFLAMAKRVVDTERPLFLDDVVVSLDRNHRGMVQELLEREFSDRQVIVLTHDREWYTELRHQLEESGRWIFKTLLPYETPDVGIRWSHKTTTFDDARAMLTTRPDAAGNDARKIMDVELSTIAEHLQIRLPYLRADKNDRRTAHDFLRRIVADSKRCFQKKSERGYVEHSSAIEACAKADQLLRTWGNSASHSFDVARAEAAMLIDACETAIGCFRCDSCVPPSNVWKLDDANGECVRCQCGNIRWRYGRG